MSGTYLGNIGPISNPWPLSVFTGIFGTPYKLESVITTDKQLSAIITRDKQLSSIILGR